MLRAEVLFMKPERDEIQWLHELPTLVPVPFLARRLGIARQRLYELVDAGTIESIRIGTRGIRLKRASVLRWLEEQKD